MKRLVVDLWTLGVAISLLSCCSVDASVVCGNGVLETMEECDDSNILNDDGCSENCTVEDHYHCTQTNSSLPSDCVQVLLDLSSGDHTTLDRSLEFSSLITPISLVDPSTLDFLVLVNWTYLDIVLLQGEGVSIAEQVQLSFTGIPDPPMPRDLSLYSTDYPLGVNGRSFVSGRRIEIERSIRESRMDESQLETVLLAASYKTYQIPSDYLPRHACLIAKDPSLETTACVSLYYIGKNVNRPTVRYEASDVAEFVEGQSEEIPVVRGNITVADADHPTRYLMESATARILDYTAGSVEWVSVTSAFNFTDLSVTFNSMTGTLTISGNATTQVYSDALQYLTYFNNMSQPHEYRQIEVRVLDGNQTSDPIYIQVNITNTNDRPSVSLNGETPIVTEFTSSYMEGSGQVAIIPNINVIDIDPNALIIRATVVLTNPVDGGEELLNLTDSLGLKLNLTSPQHTLELSGVGSPANYTAALRSLTYHHLSSNPSTHSRILEFTVEDTYNATSSPSLLTLDIIAVNDAPVLSFLSGRSQELFSYTEDDPAINIGNNLTLLDIDSPIQSVTLYLTNLLDGSSDSVDYDSALVAAADVNVSTSSNGTSRYVVFSGPASDYQYTEILRNLTYINLHTTDSVTDGRRTISISATDTEGRETEDTLTLLVDVAERNDGPAIDLGGGRDEDHTITFTEGEHSVAIGVGHLISVIDEEGHTVSGMEIELVATNGPLDEGDTLLIRSQDPLPFILDPNTTITNTRISISLPGNSSDYAAALQTVRYSNTEQEPTLYVNGVKLIREIIVRITDSAVPVPTTNIVTVMVEIEAINDNAPRIFINSDPMCTQDFRDTEMSSVSRRSVSSRHSQRRRRKNGYIRNANSVAAPLVSRIDPGFMTTTNKTCLTDLVVHFSIATSAPVVEVQRELVSLLTFAPASLAKIPHYGYWRDYSTLVIVFRECAQWERTKKPLYVVFFGSEGPCDWDSPCNDGVCYYNGSGCPAVGYHRVNICTNEGGPPQSDPVERSTTQYGPDRVSVVMLCSVLLVVLLTVAACQCRKTVQGWYSQGETSQSKSVIPSHVFDIHIPPSTTKQPLTPPPPERNGVGESLKPPVERKCAHSPPSYVKSCPTTITSTGSMVVSQGSGEIEEEKSHPNDAGGKELAAETGPEGEGEGVGDVLRRGVEQAPTDGEGADQSGGGRSGVEEVGGWQRNSKPPTEHSRHRQSNSHPHNLH